MEHGQGTDTSGSGAVVAARPAAMAMVGLLVGGGLGLVDAVDTMAGGFVEKIGLLACIQFAVICVVGVAGAGAVVGLLYGVFAQLVRKRGITWVNREGLRVGARLRLPTGWLPTVAGVWAVILTAGTLIGIVQVQPLGFDAWLLFVVIVVVGAGLLLVLRSVRSHALAPTLTWAASLALMYFIECRLLYEYSRKWPMSIVHALGLVHLLVFSIVALSRWDSLRAWIDAPAARVRKIVVTVTVVAALSIAYSLPSVASHHVRLLVHDRSALAYRAFESVPGMGTFADDPLPLDCDRPTAPAEVTEPPAIPKVRGVVLIMVDSLRADRITKEHAPNLAKFAARSTQFTRAYTTFPATRETTKSLMTGSLAHRVDASTLKTRALGPLLRDAGVKTLGNVAHERLVPMLVGFDSVKLLPQAAIARGNHTSGATLATFKKQLASVTPGERFFLFTHFFDPHEHYIRNPQFSAGRSEESRYDAEVKYTDHYIGELLKAIETAKMQDDVAVLILSDHGDEFWEHRYVRHGVRLYDESIRISFIAHHPAASRANIIDVPVSVTGVASTVLDLLGVQRPHEMEGVSLAGAIAGQSPVVPGPLFFVAAKTRRVGVLRGHDKLILDRELGILEYYDLSVDPKEQHNLADEHTAEQRELECVLHEWMRREGPI